MEEEVAAFRKYGRNTQLYLFGIFLVIFISWLAARVKPIPEFSELKVTEGVLVGIVNDSRRSIPELLLRKRDGTILNARIGSSNKFSSFTGSEIIIWTANECLWFGYMCKQGAFQAQYRDEFILDYRNVRSNMEKVRYGISDLDLICLGLTLLLFLLYIFTLYDNKKKLKKILNGEGINHGKY